MKKLIYQVSIITFGIFLMFLYQGCDKESNPVNGGSGGSNEPDPTRLYLVADDKLSTSPSTASGTTQYFIYSSNDWTVVLAGDMVGTKCTFGILFGAPPGQDKTAIAEIIVKRDTVETVVTSKTFQVTSSTYTRFIESVQVSDPNCLDGDILILRITNATGGASGLGVLGNNVAPNDSYIEVPNVEIK